MNFRLELQPKSLPVSINIQDSIGLIGSCFTSHMGARLRQMKFKVLENPHGVLFNPFSIANAVQDYIHLRQYHPGDLFLFNELWQCWNFHGDFASPKAEESLRKINASIDEANGFLQQAQWLMITLGSAFVYELSNDSMGGSAGSVAANCHKVPANHFIHRLASLQEVSVCLRQMIEQLQLFNPSLKIIFTISPVRHYREGLVENNRSKGTLHLAVAEMVQQFAHCLYFPAYELVIDDLRDYRFYMEDMVHPNHAATQYVWEKFSQSCIDQPSKDIMQQLEQVRIAAIHRPQHPGSAMHQQFLAKMKDRTLQLLAQYPFLDLNEELQYFSNTP